MSEVNKAKIFFANENHLTLHEGDLIIPIKDGKPHPPISLETSYHDGLIPSLLYALSQSDYFYVNDINEIVYKESSIVKIRKINKPSVAVLNAKL